MSIRAWWGFDECQGTVVHDQSGHGLHGVNDGGDWVQGPCGCALSLTDQTAIVRGIPATLDDAFGGGFGLSATFKWYGPTGTSCYLMDARSAHSGFLISVQTDGRLAFTFCRVGGNQTITSTGPLLPQAYTCVGIGFDPFNAIFRIYVNGVLDLEATGVTSYEGTSQTAAIGNNVWEDGNYRPFNGEIEAIRIYELRTSGECPECPALSGVAHQVPGGRPRLAPPAPNPSVGETTLRFVLASPGPVDLGVWSVDGRRVAALRQGWEGAGEHAVLWDGRDDHRREVPTGVYFVRLRTGPGEAVERLCRIR